jgi:hypothetical protein
MLKNAEPTYGTLYLVPGTLDFGCDEMVKITPEEAQKLMKPPSQKEKVV